MSEETETTVDAADLIGTDTKAAPAKVKATGMPKKVKILLEENDDIPPTGLPLGHNGTSYILRPGEAAEIPEFLLDILDHAVMSKPVTDPQTKQVIGYRDQMRYSYRRL